MHDDDDDDVHHSESTYEYVHIHVMKAARFTCAVFTLNLLVLCVDVTRHAACHPQITYSPTVVVHALFNYALGFGESARGMRN